MISDTPRDPTLLVVDDDPSVLATIERFASGLGFAVVTETSGRAAIESLPHLRPDGAIVDVRLRDVDGFTLLRAIKTHDSLAQVILMTGAATVESAIEAIKAGALDYVAKPFDMERLRELLTTVRKSLERRETLMRIDADVARQFEFYGLIGRSPGMQELFDSVRRFAPYARTVLVTGETGTGKELVARALHRLGPRKDRRLITVNCSAVVETLFESELFGHVRGAFTGATDTKVGLFEHADAGTIFLDEIGELPLPLQAKMLRAVEYGEVQRVGSLEARKANVFAIAATNRDLRESSAQGKFRSDLYFRLSTIELHIPPLRERREDIPYLTAAFIREFATKLNRPIKGITAQAERLLQQAQWTGNVRELRNVVERACILTDSRIVTEREMTTAMSTVPTAADVVSGFSRTSMPSANVASGFSRTWMSSATVVSGFSRTSTDDGSVALGPDDPESTLMATAQREQILRVLQQVGGNKVQAAKQLGMSRRSLYRWIDRLGVAPRNPGSS